MARRESRSPFPGRVTMRHSAGPTGPMIASHRRGGFAGRPMGRGPSAWRCRKAARRLDPQSPPATAVW
eukprot:10177186-Alexandrium_andersonii.AAC.1